MDTNLVHELISQVAITAFAFGALSILLLEEAFSQRKKWLARRQGK